MVQRWHGYFIGGFLQELLNPAPIGVESRAKANTPLNPLSPAHDGGTQRGLSCFSGLEWKAGWVLIITCDVSLLKKWILRLLLSCLDTESNQRKSSQKNASNTQGHARPLFWRASAKALITHFYNSTIVHSWEETLRFASIDKFKKLWMQLYILHWSILVFLSALVVIFFLPLRALRFTKGIWA